MITTRTQPQPATTSRTSPAVPHAVVTIEHIADEDLWSVDVLITTCYDVAGVVTQKRFRGPRRCDVVDTALRFVAALQLQLTGDGAHDGAD